MLIDLPNKALITKGRFRYLRLRLFFIKGTVISFAGTCFFGGTIWALTNDKQHPQFGWLIKFGAFPFFILCSFLIGIALFYCFLSLPFKIMIFLAKSFLNTASMSRTTDMQMNRLDDIQTLIRKKSKG